MTKIDTVEVYSKKDGRNLAGSIRNAGGKRNYLVLDEHIVSRPALMVNGVPAVGELTSWRVQKLLLK